MKLLGVCFLRKTVERVCVTVVNVSDVRARFSWSKAMVVVGRITGAGQQQQQKKGRLSLHRTQASFASECFSACLKKNKEQITRDAEVFAAITQEQRRVTFPEIDPETIYCKKKKKKVSCGIFVK